MSKSFKSRRDLYKVLTKFVKEADRVCNVLSIGNFHLLPLEHACESNDVSDVIVDDQHFLGLKPRIGKVAPTQHVLLQLGNVGDIPVQEECGLIDQPLHRI